jgi:hypothetical protein
MRGRADGAGRVGAGAWLAVCVAGLAALPAAGAEMEVQVRGSIVDEAGAPVPGHVVRLLKSRTIVKLAGLTRSDQNVEETRAQTDEHGYFEFRFPVDRRFRYDYLRFYDPKQFDAVKYRVPEDRDISKQVRQGRPVQISLVLKNQPDWPRVRELIERYGAASHCGQILRSLGLPTRRTPQGEGRELWEFDAAGVAYLIEGSKVLETRRIPKSGPGPFPDDGAVPERPEPAAHVEGP